MWIGYRLHLEKLFEERLIIDPLLVAVTRTVAPGSDIIVFLIANKARKRSRDNEKNTIFGTVPQFNQSHSKVLLLNLVVAIFCTFLPAVDHLPTKMPISKKSLKLYK